MKILALDYDGVLNDHVKHPGSMYCGIKADCMAQLNRVLQETDANILLSTAWRYQLLCGSTTIRGMEFLLYSHGLIPRHNHAPWLLGHTPADEVIGGRDEKGRVHQIMASLYSLLPREPVSWAVVDDLELKLPEEHHWRFVRTRGNVGLTASEADRLIEILNGKKP